MPYLDAPETAGAGAGAGGIALSRWRGCFPATCAMLRAWGAGAAVAVALLAAGCDDRAAGGKPAGDQSIEAGTAIAGYPAEFDAAYAAGFADGAGIVSSGAGDERDAGTRFRRSDAIARQVSSAFLDDYRPIEVVTRSDLRDFVAAGGALSAIHAEMTRSGLDVDDMVDAATLHDVVHWSIANQERVPEQALPRIRDAIRPRIALQARRMRSDRERQQFADRAGILAAIRSNEYARLAGRGDGAAARRYSDQVARDFLDRYGIDLRSGSAEEVLAGDRALR